MSIQNRKSLSISYTPAMWPRYCLSAVILFSAACLFYLPLVLWHRMGLLLLLALAAFMYWRILLKAPVQILGFSQGAWYVQITQNTPRIWVKMDDAVRPLPHTWVLVLRAKAEIKGKITLYFGRDNVSAEQFSALSRILLHSADTTDAAKER